MTDLRVMVDMLQRANINFEVENGDQMEISISVPGGYIGFVSVFTFDPEGNLINVGAFE
jgi:hypothetical protein